MRLTADEISGLTAEEAAELKAKRQAAVRDTLDAEKKGTGELKLAKTSNLSDLPDKGKARKNLEVYSTAEIDRMMDGKLGLTPLTRALSSHPNSGTNCWKFKTGSFAYIDEGGISHAQVEGYVMTSQVVRELKKKAERLMGGYNASEKDTIATNLNLYTKAGADARFAALENLFQDYIDFLTGQGKSPWKPGSSCGTSWTCCPKTKSSRTTCARTAKFPTCPCRQRRRNGRDLPRYRSRLCGRIPAPAGGYGMDAHGEQRLGNRYPGAVYPPDREYCVHTGVYQYRTQGRQQLGRHRCRHPNKIQPPRYSVRCSAADWGMMTTSTTGAPRSPSTAVRAGYSFTSAVCTMSM